MLFIFSFLASAHSCGAGLALALESMVSHTAPSAMDSACRMGICPSPASYGRRGGEGEPYGESSNRPRLEHLGLLDGLGSGLTAERGFISLTALLSIGPIPRYRVKLKAILPTRIACNGHNVLICWARTAVHCGREFWFGNRSQIGVGYL